MNNQTVADLKLVAKEKNIKGYSRLTKAKLVEILSETLKCDNNGQCKLVLPENPTATQ